MPNKYKDILPTVTEIDTPVLSNDDVRAYIDSTNYSTEIKTAVMTIVRQEVMHDENRNNIGMNNNLVNAQSDGDLWPSKFNKYFTGSFFTKGRWFLAFDTWQHSIDLMLEQVKTRGMYIGGYAPVYAKTYIDSVDTFVNSYYKEWVRGETNPTVPIDNNTFKGIKSIYNQEYKYFSQSIQKKNQQLQELLSSAIDNSRYNIRFFLLGK